ncbi:DUF456 family protein [Anaerobacillus sp. HL2]|nr:DUF456 family protein [Anaerobacillus sp. HL2]
MHYSLSFVGLVFPIIPSVLVIWGGFLIFQFLISPGRTVAVFSGSWMVVLTINIFIVDFVLNSHFVKKSGGSKW